MRTKQEVFEIVATHLIKQGKRSSGEMPQRDYGKSICLYRGPDGTKCAVGVLIPDNRYVWTMEGWGVDGCNIESKTIREAAGIPQRRDDPTRELIARLQETHDNIEPALWRDALWQVAKEFGVTWPEGV